MTKSNLEGKRFVLLTVPLDSSSFRAVRAGTQTGQEPGDRSRGGGGVLVTGLLTLLSSRTLDYQPRDDSTHLGWALPQQLLIKKMPYSQISCRHFLASQRRPTWPLSWKMLYQQPFHLCLACPQVLTHSTGPTFCIFHYFLIVLVIKPRASCLLGE